MVLGNVPKLHVVSKLHAVLGFLAATVAIPIGCSDDTFSGCEASRTCKPSQGGDSGSGGEAGAGDDTGGSSGSSSSGSGPGGADDGGRSGDDTERPTVVTFTPLDGDVDIERDIEVTAELSEPIDEASVTNESVTLEGPDGEVSGTLSVAENVISFVPDKPLYLLGTYTFTLSDTVADLAGNTLAESASVGFQVRDGRWSEPTFPFGETVPRVVTQFQRNAFGDVVLGMATSPGPGSVYGAVYHAAEDQWTPATELRATARLLTYGYGLGIDAAGRAVVTWTSTNSSGSGWSRFTEEGDWVNAGSLGNVADVFVTPEGLATAVWAGNSDWPTRTQDLSDGSVEPEEPYSVSDTVVGPYPVASLERMALVGVHSTTGGDELTISWKASSGWGTPELLASASDIGSLEVDSDEQGNMVVVWRENDQIWSRIYDRANDEWTRELFVMTATPDAIVLFPDMTSGNAIVAINAFDPDPGTWAAVYQAGVGWIEDSILRLDSEWAGGAVAVSIDDAGNALAAWHPGFKFRRYIASQGWQAPSSLDANINGYYMWAAGAPDGTALVAGTEMDQAGQNNRAPWVVRFE